MSKTIDKIKKNVKAHAQAKGLKLLETKPEVKKPEVKKPEVKKPEVKKPEVKKPEVKDTKPKAIRQTFDAYHIESGSLASQVIAYILECNRKQKDVTMKDIRNKFGNTFYSIFCRLEERHLAHREKKLLFVHEIGKPENKILEVVKPRVGANDQIAEEEKKRIAKLLESK